VNRLTHLLDNSVYARLRLPRVANVVGPMVEERRIGRCRVLELEALFSARDPVVERRDLVALLPLVATHDADWERAADVMERLAAGGRHRAAPWQDALLAAVAERTGLAVLHYDRDFDTIGSVTGQAMEAVAPLGSLE
jgi:predicted nucleic acid-binding protein